MHTLVRYFPYASLVGIGMLLVAPEERWTSMYLTTSFGLMLLGAVAVWSGFASKR